jgi:rhomboid protease GluP
MPNCVSCGRELEPGAYPDNICPECRARATVQAYERARANRPSFIEAMVRVMPVTSAIIAAKVLVFVAMTFSGASPTDPQTADLVKWGANTGVETLQSQPWRMWTSNYVHIGFLHIALNMWCLWSLGVLAERVFDRWTYFMTYTCCGIAGSLASLAHNPAGTSAGASGAIFGLAGALISALYLGHLPVPPRALKSTLKSLVAFAVYNLIFGEVVPGIDNSAHLGGLACGFLLGAVLAPHLMSPRDEKQAWSRWVFIVSGILLFVVFVLVRRSVLRTV